MKFNTLKSLLFTMGLSCFSPSVLGINAPVKDTRARMTLRAYPSDFHVTKDEDCFVVNQTGYIIKTNLSSSLWTVLKKPQDDTHSYNVPGYYSIHELSDKSLVISGDKVSSDSLGAIYRSGNGGKSFDNSSTQTHYIDAMYTDGKNKLWAVDIDQNFYHSNDAGKTWEKKSIYASFGSRDMGKQRTSDIYFEADGVTGYISTNNNLILKTTNNGNSFRIILTPGDQNPNKGKGYGINRVEYFRPVGNHYFVAQYNNIYMSDKDNIKWQKIDTLEWVDRTDNGELMAITTNNNVALFDSNLKLKWMQKIPKDVVEQITLKDMENDRIYFLMDNFNICSIGIDGLKTHEIYSDKKIDYTEEELKYSYTDTLKGNIYLTDGNDIMCKDESGTWFRFASIPGKIWNKWKKEGTLCVSDRNFNKYKINIDKRSVEPYVSNVTELDDQKVMNFILEKVSGGCIGAPYQAGAIYENKKGLFKQKEYVNTFKNKKEIEKEIPKEIDVADVDNLFRAVVRSMKGIEDTIKFNVTEEDKIAYKEYIGHLAETGEIRKEEKNFYNSFVDTIGLIDQKVLLNILSLGNPYDRTSTARTEKNFVFLLSNGEYLIVQNIAYHPGYLCTPWYASYKGENFLIKSVQVGMLLDKATGGVFLPEPSNKKSYAIFKIANYFLRQQ